MQHQRFDQLRADHPFVALSLQEGLLRELAVSVRALASGSAE